MADDQTAAVQALSEQAQSEQVLAQEHLDYLAGIPSVAAQVIDIGSANFEQSIEMDRGSADGVVVGQPVVSGGGLIGKVTSVSAHLATVDLLDDPSFTVGVRVVAPVWSVQPRAWARANPLQVEDVNVGRRRETGRRAGHERPAGRALPRRHPGRHASLGQLAAGRPSSSPYRPTRYADLVNLQFVRVLLWSPQTG